MYQVMKCWKKGMLGERMKEMGQRKQEREKYKRNTINHRFYTD